MVSWHMYFRFGVKNGMPIHPSIHPSIVDFFLDGWMDFGLTQCRHLVSLILANIGSGNGFLSDGTKPWPKPMWTYLKDSHTVLRLFLPNPLKPDVKSRMKM